jgi:hypothetical protein
MFAAAVFALLAAYIAIILRDHRTRFEVAPLRVLAGEIPPMVRGDGGGAEIELLRRALPSLADRELEVTVFPFSRHWRNIDTLTQYDLILTVPQGFDLGGANTAAYVEYQNGVVYRRSVFPDGLGSDPLGALDGRRVVGFAGATRVIEGVESSRRNFSMYLERYSQHRQTVMLASGFADAVIAERSIVEFYLNEVADDLEIEVSDFVFEPVFCPTRYVMTARDGALRDEVNRTVRIVRAEEALAALDREAPGGGLSVRESQVGECVR